MKELTDGRGADIVVEVVGLVAATVEGLDMVRINGKSMDIGNMVPQTVTLPATKIISQQIRWLGLMHYNPWIIPAALDLLVRTKGQVPPVARRIPQLPAAGGLLERHEVGEGPADVDADEKGGSHEGRDVTAISR